MILGSDHSCVRRLLSVHWLTWGNVRRTAGLIKIAHDPMLAADREGSFYMCTVHAMGFSFCILFFSWCVEDSSPIPMPKVHPPAVQMPIAPIAGYRCGLREAYNECLRRSVQRRCGEAY